MTHTANNPQLLPPFYDHFPTNMHITPQLAAQHLSPENNPFITGSPYHLEFDVIHLSKKKSHIDRLMAIPEVQIVRMPSKRRVSQPAFRLDFETLHDARMRMVGGSLFVGATMYYVRDVVEVDKDFLLILENDQGKQERCFYKRTPEIDLRTPEPQYFTEDNHPSFLCRIPLRQNRQCIGYDNLFAKSVGKTDIHGIDPRSVARGMSRDFLQWDGKMLELMVKKRLFQSVRMSRDIAFYRDTTGTLNAEYRGRPLGVVNEDYITVDELDFKKPWIRRDAGMIGCRVRTS